MDASPPQNMQPNVPLIVDVDGTLIRADISLESFIRIARSGWHTCVLLMIWILRGRAYAKTMAARRSPITASRLPYRKDVIDHIDEAREAGRTVILASASHWRNIHRIAQYLGLSGPVIATRGQVNMKGSVKLAGIYRLIGRDTAFDYIGDSKADIPIWVAARQALSVGLLPRAGKVQRLGEVPSCRPKMLFKAMRPHQWAKNALVFVPAILSGAILRPDILGVSALAALALSLIASAIYLLNDLLDIDSDRAH